MLRTQIWERQVVQAAERAATILTKLVTEPDYKLDSEGRQRIGLLVSAIGGLEAARWWPMKERPQG